MDDSIFYATARSEPLPVDVGAGHSVAASRLQLVRTAACCVVYHSYIHTHQGAVLTGELALAKFSQT